MTAEHSESGIWQVGPLELRDVGEDDWPDDPRLRAERHRLLGQLASGLAHDLRNVQNGVFLRIQLLEQTTAARHPNVAKLLAQMRRDVQVGVELLDRIRGFGHEESSGRGSLVDLEVVAWEACALAGERAPGGGRPRPEIKLDLAAVRRVTGFQGELVSAVLNLVINAMDALPARGPVVVRTGMIGNRVWIEVADEGPGIAPAVQARMFERYFTTKGNFGSGIGLASVAECVRRHAGEVTVKSAPGVGTTVRMSFRTNTRAHVPKTTTAAVMAR